MDCSELDRRVCRISQANQRDCYIATIAAKEGFCDKLSRRIIGKGHNTIVAASLRVRFIFHLKIFNHFIQTVTNIHIIHYNLGL